MKKIVIRRSAIHGQGMFAGEDIRNGEHIQIIRGTIAHKVTHSARDSHIIGNWIGIGKDLWIKPLEPFLHLNHSCEPNAAIFGKRILVALKNIRLGQEITMDYSITDADMHWKIPCHCGAKYCRKNILPIQKLSPKIFKKYLPNIPTYFQKMYMRANPQVR